MGIFSRITSIFRAQASPVGDERRSLESPTFAVNPAQLDNIWGFGPTRSGVQINEHTAMTVVAVYAAHKILGETIGMLPWAVYEGDEDDKERHRDKESPAYPLLRYSPNEEVTAFTFKETLMHHVLGWGNAYARILFDNAGRPKSLRILTPDRTHPERKGGRLQYRTELGDTFDPAEILHIPGLSFDGLKGYSPIAMARESIGAGKAAEIFGATFFGNGATVMGVLKFPGKLKPEAKANLRESWHAMYGGTGNSNKTAILEEGMEYARVGIPPDEAQFMETRKFSIIDIARLYRIPPHMLGDHERATHSNIEQASLEFLVYTMSPWLAKFEQEATRKLCQPGQNYVKFDERALLRADLTARQNYYASGRQWGYLSANDVLRMEGEQPIGKQGDVYLSPANEQNAKLVIQQTAPAEPTQAGKPGSGSAPFGGADPAAKRAIAAGAMRVVFEDAIGRMLRKESNALARIRNNPEKAEKFYAEHQQHVREALSPAVRSLGLMLGSEIDSTHPAIEKLSVERHAEFEADLPVLSAAKAGELIQQLSES
ncbi:MAG: phage portal protein [Patescibacteria group bacterium]|nr:phage portal protein [Patescibacteria group bacterium]